MEVEDSIAWVLESSHGRPLTISLLYSYMDKK